MANETMSVSQLNHYISAVFEFDEVLNSLNVVGEISNLKLHSSGHMYFSLVDDEGKVKCVMFASNVKSLKFVPENGMKVVARGNLGVYAKAGEYQIYVSRLTQRESADKSFQRLLAEYTQKGYIRSEPAELPMLPQRIALVTSPTGAAVHDMISVLRRRCPFVEIIVCPVPVQGNGAAEKIAAMIEHINKRGLAELIITGRGGGSSEDLSCFSEECVVRAVAQSEIPVISAVGHEVDYALSDFAAHRRAATPSMAAEIAVPDVYELKSLISLLRSQIESGIGRALDSARARLTRQKSSPVLSDPNRLLAARILELLRLRERLDAQFDGNIAAAKARLERGLALLEANSNERILQRGYFIAQKKGKIIGSEQLAEGGRVEFVTAKAIAEADIISVKERS